MIQSIHIKNFKSVVDLRLELGSFNVLVGENGCGKSNILEGIAFAAAAAADKLGYEFLGSRGIRLTRPEFMRSAFVEQSEKKTIDIEVVENEQIEKFSLNNNPENPEIWIDLLGRELNIKLFNALYFGNEDQLSEEVLKDENYITLKEFYGSTKIKYDPQNIQEAIIRLGKVVLRDIDEMLNKNGIKNSCLPDFILYAPEETSLRSFEDTTQMYPLGIRGAGLFQYLKKLALDKKHAKIFNQIKKNLTILDWFEDVKIPRNLMSNEFSLNVRDRYLNRKLNYFDQKSANEGFLYLLFYFTLFASPATPTFFAIDNIDTSLNPKLCVELIKKLVILSKKQGKQVIVTTHNPAILDGLNLKDEQQRLFVVRRNEDGHTKASRIEYNPKRTMKLSEIWTNGFIGGLPNNF